MQTPYAARLGIVAVLIVVALPGLSAPLATALVVLGTILGLAVDRLRS